MRVESLEQVSAVVVRTLGKAKIRHFITGMFAGNYWLGKRARRLTFDVDVSIQVAADRLGPVMSAFEGLGWGLTRRTSDLITYRVEDTMFMVDLLPAPYSRDSGDVDERRLAAYFERAYRRCVRIRLGGRTLRVARPEDVVIVKLMLDRAKDLDDVKDLLRWVKVDERYLRWQVELLGLEDRHLRIARSMASE